MLYQIKNKHGTFVLLSETTGKLVWSKKDYTLFTKQKIENYFADLKIGGKAYNPDNLIYKQFTTNIQT